MALILIFVLYLAVKAITRGVEAKSELRDENNSELQSEENISDELIKIKKLHQEGIIDEEEFKKAKEKILK